MAALDRREWVPILLDLKPSLSSPTKRAATRSALRTSALMTQLTWPEVLTKVSTVVLLVVLLSWRRRWTSAAAWRTRHMVSLLVQNSVTVSMLLFFSLVSIGHRDEVGVVQGAVVIRNEGIVEKNQTSPTWMTLVQRSSP